MDPAFTWAMGLVAVPWSLAVSFKAVRALKARRPYALALWDGGLFGHGRSLDRRGAFAMLASAFVVVSAWALALALTPR